MEISAVLPNFLYMSDNKFLVRFCSSTTNKCISKLCRIIFSNRIYDLRIDLCEKGLAHVVVSYYLINNISCVFLCICSAFKFKLVEHFQPNFVQCSLRTGNKHCWRKTRLSLLGRGLNFKIAKRAVISVE